MTKHEKVLLGAVALAILSFFALVLFAVHATASDVSGFVDCMDRTGDLWECLNR